MRIENVEVEDMIEEEAMHIEIDYPRNNKVNTIEIGLCDVRAADDIRIRFDFERNGWVILQPRSFYNEIEDSSYEHCEEWIESAFCPAWKYELSEDEMFTYKPK